MSTKNPWFRPPKPAAKADEHLASPPAQPAPPQAPAPVTFQEAVQVQPVAPKGKAKVTAVPRERKAKKPETVLDKETWEGLLNCVEVTKKKNNRYFLEHAKKVAALKSKCKKDGIPFDPSMLSTVAIIRDIRRSMAFLARTKPADVDVAIDVPEEGDDEE